CASLQCVLELDPGETREVIMLLGAGPTEAEAQRLVTDHLDGARARAALDRSIEAWNRRLSVVQVRTPEPNFDALLNGWALYQALSCRMWGRTALYQSSGAYGFRDQLQDTMAFLHAEPGVARAHILRAAARQSLEGGVQHWWHPQSGRGVRTRFPDDLGWPPRAAPGLDGGGARAAAHRHRRLERRDEPRGSGRAGRERLAGLVPDHQPARLCPARGRARRRHRGRRVPAEGRCLPARRRGER